MACASLCDKLTELAERIAVRPSRSWPGLVAKAGVIKAAISEESGALEDGHCALMVVPSLLDDIAPVARLLGRPSRAGRSDQVPMTGSLSTCFE